MGAIPFLCPLIYFELQSKAYLFKLMVVSPFAFAVGGLFFANLAWRRRSFQWRPFDLLAIAFVSWMALSLLWSLNKYEGLKTLSPWVAALILSLVAGHLLAQKRNLGDFVMQVIFWAGTGVALVGLWEHLAGNKIYMVAAAPGASFGNRNMAGQFILLCLPFALPQLFSSQRWRRYGGLFGFWCMLFFLIVIRGRAGYLGLLLEVVVSSGLLIWACRRGSFQFPWSWKGACASIPLVALGMAVILVPPKERAMGMMSFQEKFDRTFNYKKYAVGGVNERIPGWWNTLYMLYDHPLKGAGVGQWRVQFPHYNDLKAKDVVYNNNYALTRLHNDFLEYWATLGTVGFILLLAPILYVLVVTARRWRSREGGDLELISSLAALAGIFVPSCTSFPLQNIVPILFVLLIMQLLVRGTKGKVMSPWSLAGIGVVLLGAAPFVVYPHYRMVKSNALYFKGDYFKNKHPRRRDPKIRSHYYRLYRQAYDYDPTDNIVIMRNIAFSTQFGNPERAIRVGREALKLFPYDKIIQLAMFEAFYGQGNLKGMREMAEMMLTYSPRYAFSHLAMGHSLWFEGRRSKALDYYQKALALGDARQMRFPDGAASLLHKRGIKLP